MTYLTWLDIERKISLETLNMANLPSGILGIKCFYDAIEVYVEAENNDIVSKTFSKWFGDWFNKSDHCVLLDISEKTIPVEILKEDFPSKIKSRKPLWQDAAYYSNDSIDAVEMSLPEPPVSFKEKLSMVAFHSFKGGVGRTTTLAAFVIALMDSANRTENPKKVLLIDADLEAPGLTYWFPPENKPKVSFVSFLEAVHYPPDTVDGSISYFANALKKTSWSQTGIEIFFLPACTNEKQLLDTPVLPEHLARGGGDPWVCSDVLYKLGLALDVDFIFVDLRAGLSEISSPLLFDPRIERFLVSTVAEQSIRGVEFILSRIKDFALMQTRHPEFKNINPTMVINLLTKEIKESRYYSEALTRIEESYYIQKSDNLDQMSFGLNTYECDFEQNLLTISSWAEAVEKLKFSGIYKKCLEWAEGKNSLLIPPALEANVDNVDEVQKLKNICDTFEYAEKGISNELLITKPIQNLSKQFSDSLPAVVSIGAKGSGKTFNYLQLSLSSTWSTFVEKVQDDIADNILDAYIFPLLQSANLEGVASATTEAARSNFFNKTGNIQGLSATDARESVYSELNSGTNKSRADWSNYWLKFISTQLGFLEEVDSIKDLDSKLRDKKVNCVLLLDGLEDIFSEISKNDQQKMALLSLLDLPNKIQELRKPTLGVIIFIREDYVNAVLTQNKGQFISRYKAHALSWDADSFLQLVYWICSKADLIDAESSRVYTLSRRDLVAELEKLWGRKLGQNDSNEAYSANWVYAALTDLNGKLQARDIVRFLKFAAEKAVSGPTTDLWTDRLLPPPAVKNALEPCSKEKVEDTMQEYLAFKAWVIGLGTVAPELKKIPFDPTSLEIPSDTLNMLREIGVVFEDTDKGNTSARYYIPEIYRAGLGFRYDKGARPRVLVLQRRAIGENLY